MSNSIAGIILAAGKGTRMKSELPKALFRVGGVPMAELIGRTMKAAGVGTPVVVVGHQGQMLIDALGDSYDYVWQHEQLGTGHAARMAEDRFTEFDGCILVTPGDVPLLSVEALKHLVEQHHAMQAACTIGTCRVPDPTGYGRIHRDTLGRVMEIVEEKDASPRIKSINEINTGIFCFDARVLFSMLPRLRNNTAAGEYYLTDVVKMIHDAGGIVETRVFEDHAMVLGVNDRWQLAEANNAFRMRRIKELCLSGVTVVDPSTTYLDVDVEVGHDTTILPMTVLSMGTKIGAGCEIGPNCWIEESVIEDGARVAMSKLTAAKVGRNSRVGPFAHLRPGSVLGAGCKVGNFVETKKAEIEDFVSISHLTYIGDATVGSGSNIGAGTITCNYDGVNKHQTVIGSGAFVGSNSTLVAPVTIGENAFVAAGSVVTKDVPAEALAVGRSRQENKEGWVQGWRKRKAEQ